MPDTYVFIIVAMGLVTYIPRWLPLFILTKYTLPGWFKDWLTLMESVSSQQVYRDAHINYT